MADKVVVSLIPPVVHLYRKWMDFCWLFDHAACNVKNWSKLDLTVDSLQPLLQDWWVKSIKCMAALILYSLNEVALLLRLHKDTLTQLTSCSEVREAYGSCACNSIFLSTLYPMIPKFNQESYSESIQWEPWFVSRSVPLQICARTEFCWIINKCRNRRIFN